VGTYGLATGAWALVASEGAFALGSLTIVSRLLPARRTTGCVAGCALLVGGAYAVLGPGPCLVVAAAASVTARVAQIRSVVRSGTAAGVSVPTWLLLASSNVAWATTGALRSDPFFAWSAVAGAASSLAVVGTCLAVSRRAARGARTPRG
jgi:hypothetical protein